MCPKVMHINFNNEQKVILFDYLQSPTLDFSIIFC